MGCGSSTTPSGLSEEEVTVGHQGSVQARTCEIEQTKSQPAGASQRCAPPSKKPCNPLSQSSAHNHGTIETGFFGPYANLRRGLDYEYHTNYLPERQKVQDLIITSALDALSAGMVGAEKDGVATRPHQSWIVFTAGAMGAGKLHVLRWLDKTAHFPLDEFVVVDQDAIRYQLPEIAHYIAFNSETAGAQTDKEAGYIAEIITKAGLEAGLNCVVDGSLQNIRWHREYIRGLRAAYSNIRVAIIHVDAPKEIVMQRSARRAQLTGRVVLQEATLVQVSKSVQQLANETDFVCRIVNGAEAEPKIDTAGVDWSDFEKQWMHYCPSLNPMEITRSTLDAKESTSRGQTKLSPIVFRRVETDLTDGDLSHAPTDDLSRVQTDISDYGEEFENGLSRVETDISDCGEE